MVAAGITVAVLALTADGLLGLLQRLVISRGITGRYPTRPAGRRTPRRIMKSIRLLPAALLTLATALAACGAPGSSARPGGPSASRGSAPAAPPAALPSSPGSVTIGSADFPEDEILAYVYADAMKAHGVTVSVHADIGERPAYIAALRDGSIGAVPEYSGSILDYLAPSATAKRPGAVYGELQQVAAAQDFAVTSYAPAQDIDTITVTKATAARYHLTTIASLKNVAGELSLGAPEPLLTLPYGVPALKRIYGVVFQRFVPLPASGTVTQTALRDGTIGAADIFSTDPSITKYGFVPLTDTKHIFAAQNVVPLFKRNVLTQPMAQACNAVSARLTTASLRNLVGEVADGVSPVSAAARWLSGAGLG
jgi:osmoprotectant transport system substrate-binding protein